jgi:hypothetical protein
MRTLRRRIFGGGSHAGNQLAAKYLPAILLLGVFAALATGVLIYVLNLQHRR